MGHHNIRFDSDPHALDGVWSPPTSRANFCEEDYVITRYIGEFINSLTNLAYVYYALRFMYGPGSRGILRPKVDFMSFSLLVLGIGSFLFHASLRQTMEFADELSMMVLMWAMLRATLQARRSPSMARAISVLLAVVFISFSVFYVWSAKIIYQVIAFNIGIVVLTAWSHWVLYHSTPAFSAAKRSDWNKRKWKGIGYSALGYFLWNIDLEYCAELRALKARVGLPWAWLLELHGWWHILTAVGVSMSMDVSREVQAEIERLKQD